MFFYCLFILFAEKVIQSIANDLMLCWLYYIAKTFLIHWSHCALEMCGEFCKDADF